MRFKPVKIYIDSEVIDATLTRRVLEKYSDVERIIITGNELPLELTGKDLTITGGKKTLHLKRFKGDPF